MLPIEVKIRDILSKIDLSGYDFSFLDKILSIRIDQGNAGLVISSAELKPDSYSVIEQLIINSLSSVAEISKTNIVFTQETPPPPIAKKEKITLPNIKKVILVASGKGGVGKSTVATNLALTLTKLGFKTGIADVDIYGPSLPHLLDIPEQPESIDNILQPLIKHGLATMSLGYLIPPGKGVAWRGPMITKAVHQIILKTNWQNLDYLIIDTPPGTGDIHITLSENYRLDGVILVSTPQQLAVEDVSRAIDLYRKLHVPIIGCIENMSYFLNPATGEKQYIFGKDDFKALITAKNLTLLESIPLLSEISCGGNILNHQELFVIYKEVCQKLQEHRLK